MDGNKEFDDVDNFINLNKIVLPTKIDDYYQDLKIKWKKINKTIDEYYNMKINHSHIWGYLLTLPDKKINKLFEKYITVAMSYRVELLEKQEKEESENFLNNPNLNKFKDGNNIFFYRIK